jgi:phage tail tape-measure protein
MMNGAKEMATLTDARKQMVVEAANELERMQTRLRKVIANIEEITV